MAVVSNTRDAHLFAERMDDPLKFSREVSLSTRASSRSNSSRRDISSRGSSPSPYLHSRSVSREASPPPWLAEHGHLRFASRSPPYSPRDEHDPVRGAIAPGDVLFVPGTSGSLAEVGTAGGFMGHFMVALRLPRRIVAGSAEARTLCAVWPAGVQEIWQIGVLESTRGVAGLNHADMLVRVEDRTGRFIIFGEIGSQGELSVCDDEAFEIWRTPHELRASFRPDIFRDVVSEMSQCSGDWSITTAARALFRSATNFNSSDKAELLEEIKACWAADPICTSVVIVFWQKYLCKMALVRQACVASAAHQSDLILKFMPLKADRGLPGEVLQAMRQCGWMQVSASEQKVVMYL